MTLPNAVIWVVAAILVITFVFSWTVLIFPKQTISLVFWTRARVKLLFFDFEKYLENSRDLGALYRYAKQQGISFRVHPDSYSFQQCFLQKTITWATTITEGKKEILIPINPASFLPVTGQEENPGNAFLVQIFFAHEIGHALNEDLTVNGCSVAEANIKKDGCRDCLLLESIAWLDGFEILQKLNQFDHIDREESAYWTKYWAKVKLTLAFQCKNCLEIISRDDQKCLKIKALKALREYPLGRYLLEDAQPIN